MDGMADKPNPNANRSTDTDLGHLRGLHRVELGGSRRGGPRPA